jgi:hypothetical protein
MSQLETQLLVEAPPAAVFDCFVQKSRWKDFSDFVDLSPGRPIAEGGVFYFGLRLLHLPPVPLRVKVLRCERPREVRWVGGIPAFPWFGGEHYFRFEDAGEGRTHLVHGEKFFGLLRGPFLAVLGEEVRKAYVRFNHGLAAEARLAAGQPQP